MKDINKAVKYSFIFGFIGAVLIPIIYELYANLSMSVGIAFLCIFALIAAVFFSTLSTKSSILGVTICIAYNGIIGMLVYILLHPVIVSFINKRAIYFQLTLTEQAMFLFKTTLILLGMYVFCLMEKCVLKAYKTIKKNHDSAGDYIDNAFSDNSDLK